MRMTTSTRLLALFALIGGLHVGGIFSARQVSATATGCAFVADSSPGWEGPVPDCGNFGTGCYECLDHISGQSGCSACSMFPDGTGACSGGPCCVTVDCATGGLGGGLGGGGGDVCTIRAGAACPAECSRCNRLSY
jgi:hypothetical protein